MIEYFKENPWRILILINYILAISAAFFIILKNINPTKTLSYVLVLVFFPFFGLLVYYFFGQEYRKSKIFNRKHILNQSIVRRIQDELKLNNREKRELKAILEDKVRLVKLMYKNEHSPLTLENKVQLLINGEAKFESVLNDLNEAKDHIHLEYYIFHDDEAGNPIIDILCEKAKQGVEVRVSVDDVGSKFSRNTKRRFKESGVQVNYFMPVFFPSFTGKMNYRNHRKIIIVDGKIGYLGGINISKEYLNPENKTTPFWRDSHLRIEGEAVKPLQIQFFMTWNFVSSEKVKLADRYFPEILEDYDDVPVQIAGSGPDTDWANIMEVIFMAIVSASKYVYITTPYFIPNDEIIKAIQIASKSGVKVKLLIPKNSDSWTAKYASNSYLEPLLESGVEVYRYCKGIIHAKTIVVDDIFCSVGTANMDYRSFNINFEINALIYHEEQTITLKNQFMEDLKDCEPVDYERWLERPKINKLKESFCRLLAPLL
ncbi:cardiolipin synthase [Mangrovimonas sp. ST2L15]|uniref:cardiolipin synthase n=1 Tax=Mangrovimonas sp. ST2L15 TaxID=1645916 RepID=UPI0006B4B455|nr:cardiolipin synthase [Mangrovimonas sp. ST2L15]